MAANTSHCTRPRSAPPWGTVHAARKQAKTSAAAGGGGETPARARAKNPRDFSSRGVRTRVGMYVYRRTRRAAEGERERGAGQLSED